MRSVALSVAAALFATAAGAADLAILKAPTAPQGSFFWVWGIEGGATLEQRTFDFATGSANVGVSGMRVGAILGPEYRGKFIMVRALAEVEYDFTKGGSTCMATAAGTRCDIAAGLNTTERLDVGFPLWFLGGMTVGASIGATQDQAASSMGAATGRQYENGFLLGGFADVPLGPYLSAFARYDRVGPRQSLGLTSPGAAPAAIFGLSGAQHDDVVKVGILGRF